MNHTIENGVEIPPAKTARDKYGLSGLEPGQSVFMLGADAKSAFSKTVQSYFYRKGWGIRSRSMDGGIRFWRVK